MALVGYVSSDDEDNSEITTSATAAQPAGSLKRKRDIQVADDLPPLPSKFHDLYASNTRVSTRDDPSLHAGRKRATPHIDGNWPTHLYIEWYPLAAEYASINRLISGLKDNLPTRTEIPHIHTFLTSDLGAPLPLHISLSRPIGFDTKHKDNFVTSLERAIKSSSIRPFEVKFSGLDWVANFEKTRWFLVLRLQAPNRDGLNKLLHISNSVVQEYGQSPLYAKPSTIEHPSKIRKDPRGSKTCSYQGNNAESSKSSWGDMQDMSAAFHISIAWTLEAPTQDLQQLTALMVRNHFADIFEIKFTVQDIKAKVGNTITSIHLRTIAPEGRGLFGL